MESPANQYVLFGESWLGKGHLVDRLFTRLRFLELHTGFDCQSAASRDRVNTRVPGDFSKNCERLTYVLAVCFLLSGLSMSAYHGLLHQ